MTYPSYPPVPPPRPGAPWAVPPAVPGRQLRTLGALTQVALFGTVVTIIMWGFAVAHDRSLVNDIMAQPGSVTLDEARQADADVRTSGHIVLGAYVITAIVFLIWLYLARINADGYDGDVHRRARPWAFWGWFVPVVSLWFPFQVVADTLRASSGDIRVPWYLRAWWMTLIASFAVWRFAELSSPSDLNGLKTRQTTVLAAIVLDVIAALLAAAVVGRLTASNDRRRAAILAVPTPPPRAG